MAQIIYFVLFLISIGYLIPVMSRFQRHISVYYVLLAVSVVFMNLGYLQMSGAKTIEAALHGNELTSLIAPFLLLFIIIAESSGSHFDPELCRQFLQCRPQIEKLYDSYPA